MNTLLERRAISTESIDMSLYENQYLTTEMLDDGTITFTIPSAVTTSNVTDVSYRKNGGEWVTTINSSSAVTITVNVVTNDVIEWKGNATCYGGGGAFADCSHWGGTASFNVYGNLMSMLYNDAFRGKKAYPSTKIRATQHMFSYALVVDATNLILPATTCYGQAYMCLFDYCTSLIYPPAVLPAPEVASAMYYNMFRGCTSMTTMPTILAQRLSTSGSANFYGMFINCSALQYNTNQTIHIEVGRDQCFQSMFQGCTSMVNAPNIDCAEIVNSSQPQTFRSMFYGCTNLQTPPERFGVNTVGFSMFYSTFANCSSLLYAPIINIRNVGTDTYYAFTTMFGNCTSLTDASGINIYFPENSEWDGERTFNEMFYGCTSMINGPSLHINGTLSTKMTRTFYLAFFNCQNMETHDIEINYDISSTATVSSGAGWGNANMFYRNYKMRTSPRMIRSALKDYEFYRIFDGGTSLRDIYVKFDTNVNGTGIDTWIANYSTLSGTRTIHLAGTLSLPTGYSGVPSGWTLDTTNWTSQRHARMTMWVDDFDTDEHSINECYTLFNTQLNDFLTTITYGTSRNIYHYYGDTLTIDGVTYFIWENNEYTNSPYKILTTTDNFYELKQDSAEVLNQKLQPSTDNEKLLVITIPFTHMYGKLEDDVLMYDGDTSMWPTYKHLMAIKRNQG